MQWLLFAGFYACYQSLVVAILWLAYKDGELHLMLKHGGIMGDLVWLSFALAWVTSIYANQWNVHLVLAALIVATLVGIPLLQQWMAEGKANPGPLGREGFLTIGGAIHYLYMVIAMVVILCFFLTPNVQVRDVIIVTGLLMMHIAIGILQPIWLTTGQIPKHTWVIFASGWGVTLLLGAGRILVTMFL